MPVKNSADVNDTVTKSVGEEMFELFKEKVLGRQRVSPSTRNEIIFRRNLRVLCVACTLVFFSDLLWLILDHNASPENKIYSQPALIVGYTHMGLSVYMVIMSLVVKRANSAIVRISMLIYYFYQIFDVSVLAINFNIHAEDAGAAPGFIGVTISTFFLFILDFAPLPSIVDLVLLCLAMLAGCFAPLLFPGSSVYGVAEHITIRLYTIVTYIFIRKINMQNAEKDTRLVAMNEKTLEASYVDKLTLTFNRRALDRYWRYLIDSADVENVAVFIFDIDNFKKYNDTYTHSEGDKVITGVCDAVETQLVDDCTFLFRYGGEEFVLFLINPTDEEIIKRGTAICEAVRSVRLPRDDGTDYPYITITVGCATENVSGDISGDYIVNADKQLYIGKDSKKNCLVYKDEVYR